MWGAVISGVLGAVASSRKKGIDMGALDKQLTSPYTAQMAQRSEDLLDPTSSLMRMQKGQFTKQAEDNAYTQNRMARQRFAGSGLHPTGFCYR